MGVVQRIGSSLDMMVFIFKKRQKLIGYVLEFPLYELKILLFNVNASDQVHICQRWVTKRNPIISVFGI